MSGGYESILVSDTGKGRFIRFNRPARRNALSNLLIAELTDALADAVVDPDVAAIVLYGDDDCFSAGADLSEAVALDGVEFRTWSGRFRAMTDLIETSRQPVVASIAGYCFTGGLELALACDVRIAADNAQFAITSARIGSLAGFGGTQRLPRVVGPSRAKRMLFRAEPIGAEEALAIGLVDVVVPVERLRETVEEEVALYSTRGPVSLAMAKRAVDLGLRTDLPTGLDIETDIAAQVFATEDKREGMQAFLEKRSPRFVGR